MDSVLLNLQTFIHLTTATEMTNEQILELAEKCKFCCRDEDEVRNWKVTPSIILEFARAIYEEGYDDGCFQATGGN